VTANGANRDKLAEIARLYGLVLPPEAVCPGHASPLDFLESWCLERPSVSLVTGPRGGGKSFLSAFAIHLDSTARRNHATKVLGGSLAQSQQIYRALQQFARPPTPAGLYVRNTASVTEYATGSEVSILAASSKSVRGPHVPTLRLDEVDEIDDDLRNEAMGMCVSTDSARASLAMTSTWHRVGGPMARLRDQAFEAGWPQWTFCIFDVLEPCQAERSGPRVDGPELYQNCPECPIRPYCHADVRPTRRSGRPEPKAKRSAGHYAIDALIQKARIVSASVFGADYLCAGPRSEGLWFPNTPPQMVDAQAGEYDPALPVYLAIDSGVFTSCVWFQVADSGPMIRVFGDYLSEGISARASAAAILETTRSLCNDRRDAIYTDPAGKARTAVGPTVLGEYERSGLKAEPWPLRPVADGLALVESFVAPAAGGCSIAVHPRCKNLIAAFQHYRRAKRAGQWMDWPEDPQHPHEDLMDALRGGLCARFPDGRRPAPKYATVQSGKVF